jgi:general secretion pathway protein G
LDLRAGFTLIEVLLVVAILGILATVVVVNFAGKQKGSMIKAARASIANLCTAIDKYELDTGKFPQGFQSLLKTDGAPNWKGPYIKGGLPVDPWGVQFQYTPKGENGYEVRSAGPDTQMNTEDDITSFANEG